MTNIHHIPTCNGLPAGAQGDNVPAATQGVVGSSTLPITLQDIEESLRNLIALQKQAERSALETGWYIGDLLNQARREFYQGDDLGFGQWASKEAGHTQVWRWKRMKLATYPIQDVMGYGTLDDALVALRANSNPAILPVSPHPYTGPCEIIIGDCEKVLAERESDFVDLIVTSPPYADLRAEHYGGPPPGEYVDWFLPKSEQFLRVLNPTGSFILNIGRLTEQGQESPYVFELVLALREQGWWWAWTYFWWKTNPMPGRFGKRGVPAVEYIFWFAKSRDYFWDDKAIRTAYQSEPHPGKPKSFLRDPNPEQRDFYQAGGALPPDYFTWTKAHVSDGAGEHTAVFPIELPEWFILAGCPVGGTVLDPFAGSGTTGLAAEKHNRKAILIEENSAYEAVIKKRLGEQRQLPMGGNGGANVHCP